MTSNHEISNRKTYSDLDHEISNRNTYSDLKTWPPPSFPATAKTTLSKATMTSQSDSFNADLLVGEINRMLDAQFLQVATQGGIFQQASAHLVCALAMLDSKGHGLPREERAQCVICHDELVRLVRSGLRLNDAVHIARRKGPARPAFQKLQALVLARLEGQTA